MSSGVSRRRMMQAMGAAALSPVTLAEARVSWPPAESSNRPKICLGIAQNTDEARMRRLKQIGVDYVLMEGPRIPWEETGIRGWIERFKAAGLTLCNMMISGFSNTLDGRPGRDEEIDKVIQSIRAAGKSGLPVIEYNFYAHCLVEGYYEEVGRAGAGMTAFDYDRVKSLPPLEHEGRHSPEEMWGNETYFPKAVVTVAEQSGARLALHPNDPPAPISRGSGQIMSTLAGWKRLIDIVK